MKMLRFPLILCGLLLLTACDDAAETPAEIPVPERISAVGTQSFGRYPGSSDVETLIFNEKFMTDDDVLQIHIAPVSRVVYCIDLIIPQVPGDGDALQKVAGFIAGRYNIQFSGEYQVTLDQSRIEISYEYGYGRGAVRCRFTDLANERIFIAEDDSPEAAAIRQARQRRQELLLLENSLREFNLDTGTYPENLSGLLSDPGIAGWNGPYADSLPDDCFYRKTAEGFELRRGEEDNR